MMENAATIPWSQNSNLLSQPQGPSCTVKDLTVQILTHNKSFVLIVLYSSSPTKIHGSIKTQMWVRIRVGVYVIVSAAFLNH